MAIEQFSFKLSRSCRNRRINPEDIRFEVVKEVKRDFFEPATRQYYDGSFTYRQKLALEALSERVNSERRKIGIL